jgi:hypothetical protein
VVRYRTRDGKKTQRKLTICRCTDMAREQARKVFAQVAEGLDPAADRKPEKALELDLGATVERMFKGYVAHLQAKNKVSWSEVERALLLAKNCVATTFGKDTQAKDITPPM